MASSASLTVCWHGDDWPGPDPRIWKQTTLFDNTFVKRSEPGASGASGAGGVQQQELSPSLLGVPLPAAVPSKRTKNQAPSTRRTRQKTEK